MKILFIITLLVSFPIKALSDYRDIQIKRLGRSDGLSNSSIINIEQDLYGFVWIATESGLNRFDGKNFVPYKHNPNNPKSIAGNAINRLLIDKDGDLWIATTKEGLDKYNHHTDDFTHYEPTGKPGDISGPAITDLCLSHNGNIWVSTYYNGLNLYIKNQNKFKHFDVDSNDPNSIRENIVLRVYEDRQKNLWVGYRSQGLSMLNLETGKATHFIHNPQDPNSLPYNAVQAILQDRYDNIWIGTVNGLSLYNRNTKNFINFYHQPGNPKSLISNKIMSIYEMSDGKIWIGTEGGGISILDISFPILNSGKIEFQNIYSGDSKDMLTHNSVYTLFQDYYDNIWIGTYGGGINFISKYPDLFSKIEYIPFSNHKHSLNNKTPWGLCEGLDGKIWIGTDGGGIDVLNPETGEIDVITASPKTIGDNAVLCALTDSKNRMWFGTYKGGVSVYNYNSKQFKQYVQRLDDPNSIPSMDIRAIFETKKGEIILGTMNGVCQLNVHSNSSVKNVLAGTNCRTIIEDNSGNLWIGHNGGVTILNSNLKTIKSYTYKMNDKTSLLSNNVFSIYKDRKGRIWIGSENGLNFYNNKTGGFEQYGTNEGLEDNSIKAIIEDENGLLWLSTNSGISCFDLQKKSFVNYNSKDGVPEGEFMDNSCLRSKNGIIYFGSRNGLCYFSPDRLREKIKAPDVIFTRFDLFNEPITPSEESVLKENITSLSTIELSHNQNTFSVHYSVTNFALQNKTIFRYKLEGVDKQWTEDRSHGFASYKNVPPGDYTLKVEASVDNYNWSKTTTLDITVLPPIWLSWWMKIIYFTLIIFISIWLYRIYRNKRELKNNLLIEKLHLKEIEELNKEKLQFFTNISHDIKTPLTLIISPIEDLLKKDLSQEIKKKLELVHHNGNMLLKLFNRLLDFRKIENGHSKLYLTKGNIIGTIQDVCVSYKEFKKDNKIQFSYSTKGIDKLTIWYDWEKVFSIVDNLISNAFKYTIEGEITVEVSKIRKDGKDYVKIEVKDTGIGMSKKEQTYIYERFYQVKNMTSTAGTGIGLSLVKNFVMLHNGEVSLESMPGKGSVFSVLISCSLSPDMGDLDIIDNSDDKEDTDDRDPIEDNLTEELMLEKEIILIVDDNKDIREYVQSCFDDDYRVLSSDNGTSALEIIHQELPNIIISDVMMEGMDGIELCRKVKSDEATNHIPIILLTVNSSMSDKQQGYDAGADSYITKPFGSDLLKTRVSNILNARQKITDYIAKNFFNAQNKEQKIRADEVKQNKLIKNLIAIVEDNMTDGKMDIEFLSSSLCMSHSSLFRKVKALTGLSINEFVRGIRMEKAKELLITSDYSISEIAFKVGISSLRYFRQCFKEHYGVTPTDFIKNNNIQE